MASEKLLPALNKFFYLPAFEASSDPVQSRRKNPDDQASLRMLMQSNWNWN